MPHLILEYSDNLAAPVDTPTLLEHLHSALAEFPPIKPEDIKSRVIPCVQFRIGDGSHDNVFVHLTVKVFAGKTLDVRQRMSQRMLSRLSESFAKSVVGRTYDITVDICEIERETYGKKISPSS